MNLALLMQAGQSPLPTLLLFGGMAALFYFLLIRKLKAGDEVLLSGGLYATIDRVEDKNIYLKLGSTLVKARRNAVVAMANEAAPEQN
jgi:preprotein translocase subunit YajC